MPKLFAILVISFTLMNLGFSPARAEEEAKLPSAGLVVGLTMIGGGTYLGGGFPYNTPYDRIRALTGYHSEEWRKVFPEEFQRLDDLSGKNISKTGHLANWKKYEAELQNLEIKQAKWISQNRSHPLVKKMSSARFRYGSGVALAAAGLAVIAGDAISSAFAKDVNSGAQIESSNMGIKAEARDGLISREEAELKELLSSREGL